MVNLLSVAEFGLDVLEKITDRVWGPPPSQPYSDIVPGSADPLPDLAPPTPVNHEPSEVVQWGLKIPNGNVVWDNGLYCGNPLATPEQRTCLLEALKKTAIELGFPVDLFLAEFGWVRRVGNHGVVWSDAVMMPLLEPPPPDPTVNGHAFGSTDTAGLQEEETNGAR